MSETSRAADVDSRFDRLAGFVRRTPEKRIENVAGRVEPYNSGITYAIRPDRVKPTAQYSTGAPSTL